MTTNTQEEYTVDAEAKSIGRVASEAAVLLMGKHEASFQRHVAPVTKVRVTNAAKMNIHYKKLSDKKYKNFSGYPGGLKETPMNKVIEKKGYGELVRTAIKGMLPANKLRNTMMKNLTVSE